MNDSSQLSLLTAASVSSMPRLGILGGGQLAKMTAAAAAQLGCEVVVLERSENFPAQSLDTHALIGDWNNPQDVLRLGEMADVVTLENEFVELAALEALANKGHRLWPTSETIALVQDKLHQKRVFEKGGLPIPRFAGISSPEDVLRFGLPVVLKRRRNSYDGKGNATVRSEVDLYEAWLRLDGDRNALFAESFFDFVAELAVIVTRGQDGTTVCYPVVESVNMDHICHVVLAPASLPETLTQEIQSIAKRSVELIDGVGSFGLEFFLGANGELAINEIAPRVHNTGHYTIEACHASQFENHVRAVLGWPLGSPEMVAPAAAMVNLLGCGDGPGTPNGLIDALRIPEAKVHIYGKSRSAPGRKMGHVTALGATVLEARERAQRAADRIRFGDAA